MESITVVHNKTAIVTGGARGIGKAIIAKLASLGYNVVINYNTSKNDAIELENSLKSKGVSCLAVKCDVSNEEEVKNMVEAAIATFNKIDLLVNNNICLSRREAREFLGSNAISINGNIVSDENMTIYKDIAIDNKVIVVRRGKKKYFLGIIK